MTTVNRITAGDGDPRHGTANAYKNHRCRCEMCTRANAVYQRTWMNAEPYRLAEHARKSAQRRARKRQERQG